MRTIISEILYLKTLIKSGTVFCVQNGLNHWQPRKFLLEIKTNICTTLKIEKHVINDWYKLLTPNSRAYIWCGTVSPMPQHLERLLGRAWHLVQLVAVRDGFFFTAWYGMGAEIWLWKCKNICIDPQTFWNVTNLGLCTAIFRIFRRYFHYNLLFSFHLKNCCFKG